MPDNLSSAEKETFDVSKSIEYVVCMNVNVCFVCIYVCKNV